MCVYLCVSMVCVHACVSRETVHECMYLCLFAYGYEGVCRGGGWDDLRAGGWGGLCVCVPTVCACACVRE